ncbi:MULTISPECIES: hypothetical protein [Citrobacter]|uniref:hypothetical protein n=1 Tax=Citrobacter TaxID=544 RepID=UPI00227D49E4|nr:hypothetical protein [Citrobacter sp. W8]
MSIKRYEMKTKYRGHESWDELEEDKEGGYVDYEDYSALEQKLTDTAVQLANAESKCRELAAENAGLNDKMNKLATLPGIEFYSSAWEFCNLDGNDALEFMCDVKTPATDAFLAEVRAHDLNAFIRHHSAELDAHIKNGGEQFDEKSVRIRDIIVSARLFREQIRKEAAQ